MPESEPLPLTLYTAPGCCLCETLEAQIAALARELPLRLTVRNITENPEWERLYRPEIPVLFIRERKSVKYRIGTPALRARLERALGRRSAWWVFLR